MPASTAPSSDQILVGASGTVYIGAYAAVTAPTAWDSALDVDLVQVGYISEDGVTLRDSKDVTEIRAWQSPYPVRRVVTSRVFEVSFAMEQWNWQSLPFALGGGTLSEPTAGKYKYIPPDADDLDEKSMVVDWADGATKTYRLYMPRGIVTEPVEINVKRTENAMFPINFAAVFDGTNPPYTLFTNDPAFEVA